tara:strand:- start:1519 stop:2325 length:807 start_codon:yes stop_codon:yes gene_type:complete
MSNTIAVYSLWRDSEPHIDRTLKQFEDLESLDYEFEYYFYENDSEDNTASILIDWTSSREGNLLTERINTKKFGRTTDMERMKTMCDLRNRCRNLVLGSQSKYTVLIDSDIIFNKENLLKHIETIESLDDAAMVTPNIRQNIPDFVYGLTEDSYYDVYPLFDRFGSQGLYWTDCPLQNGIDRMNWSLGKPIKCNSAFGGFSLIKTDILKKVKWSTDGACDHVNFCKEVNEFGSIYIDPLNKVFANIDLSKYNLKDFEHRAKMQLNGQV